ncbi:MAG: hypothetical protein A3B30_00930 [Candidatus Komeilibacteria bacterium RIFCSPLOWO2_01_FULL_52_15]|uniref:Transport permease protein n=2 Tax=Parcubacteria group TaxID=1794811 RepID=A0A1G2T2S7_9BACT|nr:MAG: hypothetical protein A3B30_00930 [Candidatus Komeilibacteria bacterium RIFCSPLOWO2_01_FULL_52_15]OHA91442.1 MAG: hypothetical protein A2758_01060 [Candidatus Zambryskibacteria bacterium RIFCSPHIGHO2_01_FULL_49_18]
MHLSRIYAIFIRQWFLMKSNPSRLASIFMWTFLMILQWGLISKYVGTFGGSTFNYVTVTLGAIILWEFTNRLQIGVMLSFLEDIWSMNLINFFASPLTIAEYVGGLVITSVVTGLAAFLVMVLFSGFGFGYNVFVIGLLLVPFMLILFVFGVAMGIFVAGIIFRLGPSAEWLGWPIPMILSIFSGVFYPVATMPSALQVIAHVLPTSYVFESIRLLLATGSFSFQIGFNLIVGGLLALVYLAATYAFFVKIYRHNLRTGSIARFSAESV